MKILLTTPSTPMTKGRIVLCVILSVLILLNMAVIFSFSAESSEESGDRSEGVTQTVVSIVVNDYDKLPLAEQQAKIHEFHPIIRKLAHFSEFALLGFLTGALLLALGKGRYWLSWAIPAAFCLLYAISDEVHQIFTDRGPAVTDVLIDFSGSLTGLLLIHAGVLTVRTIRAKRKGGVPCEPPVTT